MLRTCLHDSCMSQECWSISGAGRQGGREAGRQGGRQGGREAGRSSTCYSMLFIVSLSCFICLAIVRFFHHLIFFFYSF